MRSKLAVCALLIALLGYAIPTAAVEGEPDGLSGTELAPFAKERMIGLTAEAQASREVADQYRGRCAGSVKQPPSENDCAMAHSAEEHLAAVVAEEQALMTRLKQEIGTLPPWAAKAQALFAQAAHRGSVHAATVQH